MRVALIEADFIQGEKLDFAAGSFLAAGQLVHAQNRERTIRMMLVERAGEHAGLGEIISRHDRAIPHSHRVLIRGGAKRSSSGHPRARYIALHCLEFINELKVILSCKTDKRINYVG